MALLDARKAAVTTRADDNKKARIMNGSLKRFARAWTAPVGEPASVFVGGLVGYTYLLASLLFLLAACTYVESHQGLAERIAATYPAGLPVNRVLPGLEKENLNCSRNQHFRVEDLNEYLVVYDSMVFPRSFRTITEASPEFQVFKKAKLLYVCSATVSEPLRTGTVKEANVLFDENERLVGVLDRHSKD